MQLPTHSMLRLVEHLAQRGGTQDISESLATALELWLAADGEMPTAADPAKMRGYQWKTLFLLRQELAEEEKARAITTSHID